jgi:conjugal transfer mating pair stabilization protein TraG
MRTKTFFLCFFLLVGTLQVCASEPLIIKGPSDTAIHTYGGGDLLAKVFNAVSMLIYGNDKSTISKSFHAILRIALTIGGFSCICIAFFREKFEPIVKCFFLPAVGIFSILLVPRTTVIIQDHLAQKVRETNRPALITVEHVPFFLGKLASLVSTVSYNFTTALEGVTHGTDDTMYNWTGHIYAAENIFQAKKCRIGNRLLEDNFREFCRECVYRDVGIGLYSKDELVHAKKLLQFLEERTSNIRTVFYRGNAENATEGGFLTCKEAMKKMNQLFYGQQGNTKEIVLGEMGNDIFFLLGQKEKGEAAIKNLIKQQIAIDVLKEEMPGTLSSFASKRAEILQKENQKILGALGASSIVAMRNFFEAMIYTVFPLMIVVSLLSFGVKPLISWVQFVLWVNTWPPFYVVVKFLLNSIWEFRKRSMWGESVDLTIFTSEGLSDLYSSMESIAAVAMAFIPFLSWIILKGGVNQMVHMASSLMSPAQTAASTAAAEKTTGNYNFGNISVDSLSGHNANMFKQSYSGQLAAGSVSLDTGRETSTYVPESKGLYVRQADSYLREGISRSEAFSSSLQDSISSSQTASSEASKTASTSIADTANKAVGLSQAVSKSIQSGNTWNEQESTSFQEAYQYLSGVAQEYGNSKGISKDDALREVFSGGLSGGGLLKMAGVKGGAEFSSQEGVSKYESDSILDKAMETESFQRHIQSIKNLSKGEVGSILGSEDAKLHEDFSHSLAETNSSVDQWRAAYSKQQALSSLESSTRSENVSFNQKLDQNFVDFVSERFDGDIGKVSDVLDLPNSNSQKRGLIDQFVAEYLPKKISPDAAPLQETHQKDVESCSGVSEVAFGKKVENFKDEMSPKVGHKSGEIRENVDSLKTRVENKNAGYKETITQKEKGLVYESSKKKDAEDAYEEPLRKHGSEKGMWVPRAAAVGWSGIQFGAKSVGDALFRIGPDGNEE